MVLVSGGLDSCVTAAIAVRDYAPAFLHADYGQRTQNREHQAFDDLCDHWQVPERLCVVIDPLRRMGGSSLTDPGIPVSRAALDDAGIPSSYVPFRNAHLLAAAASWAEIIGARHIVIGAVAEDSSGYPDCRPAFYTAFGHAIELGTRPETMIDILTPIIYLSKRDIVLRGAELHAPLGLTWSCYQREDKACGVCESCALRLRGFQQAGIEDPLPYETRPRYDRPSRHAGTE